MEKTRYHNVDLLKAIAIFFVVLYHSTIYSYDFLANNSPDNYLLYFLRTILSTCVPLFFMANGYLLFSKSFDLRKHVFKIIKLIIITVIWGLITLILLQVIKGEYFTVIEMVKALWNWKNGWINHLWYMGAMVCLYVFFPLIKQAFDTNKKIFFFFTAVSVILTIGNTIINNMATITLSFVSEGSQVATDYNFFNIFNPYRGIHGESFTYFCLGGVLYHFKEKIEVISAKKRNLVAGFGLLCSCAGLWGIGVLYSKISGSVWDVVYSGYDSIFTFINVIFIFMLCMNYKRNVKLISLMSSNTLGIYFMHMVLIELLRPLIVQYVFLKNLPVNVIFGLIVIAICLIASLIIGRIPLVSKLVK